MSSNKENTHHIINRPFEAYKGGEPYIFVSYAHKDCDLVYPEITRLHKLGYRVWYDEGIELSFEWTEEVENALRKCAYFIVFMSPNAVKSKNVRREVNLADSVDKNILPVYLEKTDLAHGMGLQLGSTQSLLKYDMPADSYYKKLSDVIPADTIGQPPSANEPLNKTFDTDAEFDRLVREGQELKNRGDHDGAIVKFREALKYRQNDSHVWYNIGDICDERGKYEPAIKCYSRAITIDHNHVAALYGKGTCLYNLEKYEDALDCFVRVLEINPRNKKAADKKQALEKIINSKKSDSTISDSAAEAAEAAPPQKKPVSVSVGPGSVKLETGAAFDLSTIKTAVSYSDGSAEAAENVEWKIKSGKGEIKDSVFRAPKKAGKTLIEACVATAGSETLAGAVEVECLRVLKELKLKTAVETINVNDFFKMRKIKLTGVYSDGSHDDFSVVQWSVISGAGEIRDNKFYAPAVAGQTVLQASFPDGMDKTVAAEFTFDVLNPLSSITIDNKECRVFAGESYDLSKISVRANYHDGSSKKISGGIKWKVKSGGGKIDEKGFYLAPASGGKAFLEGVYSESTATRPVELAIEIKAVLSHLKLSETSAVVFCEDKYDLKNIKVTAVYIDGSEAEAAPVIWSIKSGRGGISNDKIFASPEKPCQTVLFVAYSKYGEAKSAEFKIEVSKHKLDSVSINKNEDLVFAGENYDLSKLKIVARYADGSYESVGGGARWVVETGGGKIENGIYRPPKDFKTAVLSVSFTSAGVARSAIFRLIAGARLAGIEASKKSELVGTQCELDLSSIDLNAIYDDKSRKVVTGLAEWRIKSGGGKIEGRARFAAPEISGKTILEAVYAESGISRSAEFIVEIKPYLSSIKPSRDSVEMFCGGSYDLKQLTVSAIYFDGSFTTVMQPSWTVKSGKGSVSGDIFNASEEPGAAVLQTSYTKGKTTLTADLKITVKRRKLISLFPADKNFELELEKRYETNSIKLTASYSGGLEKDITGMAAWESISPGSPVRDGLLIALQPSSKAHFIVKYNDEGADVSCKIELKIKKTLMRIEASPCEMVLRPPADIDLKSGVAVAAVYTNGDRKTVPYESVKWSRESGSGIITGNFFKKTTLNSDEAYLTARYKEGEASAETKLHILFTEADEGRLTDILEILNGKRRQKDLLDEEKRIEALLGDGPSFDEEKKRLSMNLWPYKKEVDGRTIYIDMGGGVAMEMVRIPAGSFQMGSPENEKDRYVREGPVHTVVIKKDFYIGKYPVTQGQWKRIMEVNPSSFSHGDDHPVENVSWEYCQEFINNFNELVSFKNEELAGSRLRLPSEAEWEYACRAGTQARFYWGDDRSEMDVGNYCWFKKNAGNTTHAAGGRKPNTFGLYDMLGNVWEWCADTWHDNYEGAPADGSPWESGQYASRRVIRGGSFRYDALYCRCAYRGYDTSTESFDNTGFRLVLIMPE